MLHTDIPSRAEIDRLFAIEGSDCVTIYMPTHRNSQDASRNRLLLRDLTERAVASLRDAGLDDERIAAIEEPLLHLVDDEVDFWSEQADSLALFVRPEHFEVHRLPNHLPTSVTASDRFFLAPLLRAVTFPQAAWVLAISQGAVRLLEVGPDDAPVEIAVEGMPSDAWESSGNKVHRAREGAYARRVDTALRSVLSGSELPLVLAASQPMAGLFRSVATYPHLVDERLHGNAELTPDAELSADVRSVLDALYREQLDRLADRYDELGSEGRAASDLSDLDRLSTLGAIDTLIVDMDASVPMTADGASNDDATAVILERIVRQSWSTSARVLAVRAADVPGGGVAAGLLRFAV